MRLTLIILTLALLVAPTASAGSRDIIAGPVAADVVRVRDGDSIDVDAHVWPGQRIRVSVRIRGIDAPELRAKCPDEGEMARAAKKMVEALTISGRITLSRIGGGKYYGRVLADVTNERSEDVATVLLARKMVRRYQGGRRQSWCPEIAAKR